MEIIKGLNEQQREAVLSTEGPVLVIAGAGSGKTRLLVHRIAYLIKEKRVSPRQILAVTFTNKAAEEMKERIKRLLGGDFRFQPWMGTFHHICVRILRSEIDKIGYKKNFVIYDDSDQRALVKKIMKEQEISVEQFNPRAMLAVISKAKGELMRVEDYI
ncbi:MAG: UvrD-helicase domain-containing protein, partial [Candidatus Moranbacteria bacterium]|nr:UvrD-helicase domain-containing protein [Candidatus Moranbacteria bacterium]